MPVKSHRDDHQVAPPFESRREAATDAVHVVSLRGDVGHLVCGLSAAAVTEFVCRVPQLGVRRVRVLRAVGSRGQRIVGSAGQLIERSLRCQHPSIATPHGTFKISKYRLTTGRFTFNTIPGYRNYIIHRFNFL